MSWSYADVGFQIFDANGNKVGNDTQANTTFEGYQFNQDISALASGRFVLVWEDSSVQSNYEIRGRIFNGNGTPAGDEFLINTPTNGHQLRPAVAGLSDGRFVVASIDDGHNGNDQSGQAVRAQVFNADGSKSGAEFLVNTTTENHQSSPTISVLTDGRFVISWADMSGGNFDIRGQIFDAREAAVNLVSSAGHDEYIGTGFGDTWAVPPETTASMAPAATTRSMAA